MRPPFDLRSERGAVLVFVAVSIIVLAAFLTVVIDHGILWVARGQAQNAADAGALAGAVARAYDDFNSPPVNGGRAYTAAIQTAQANMVWTQTPVAQVSWNCPTGVTGACARVDVYRNGQFGSTMLPTLFGPLIGVTTQGVRATATAVAGTGTTVNCMRPFSIPDKWTEAAGTVDVFDHWVKVGGSFVELSPHDIYVAPTTSSAGTGYTVEADRGTALILKGGANPQSATDPITPGWNLPISLPDGAGGYTSGGDDFRDAIATCIGNPTSIGDYLPTETGVMNGPTGQGVGDLILQDPSATWDAANNTVANSCAPSCAPYSPRIVPISVFDNDDFQYRRVSGDNSPCPTGGSCIKIVNILGFFVDGMCGGDVCGHLMTYPGEFVLGAPSPGGGAGFLQVIQLRR